jgi:hypothetical protein
MIPSHSGTHSDLKADVTIGQHYTTRRMADFQRLKISNIMIEYRKGFRHSTAMEFEWWREVVMISICLWEDP